MPAQLTASKPVSYQVQVQGSNLTQCVRQTLVWSGPAGPKRLATWVRGTDYFAETVGVELEDTLGTIDWMCGESGPRMSGAQAWF